MQQETYSRHLYLCGEGTKDLIEKCEFIMNREKLSFNALVKEALKEYEVRHGLGNNSFQLDKFGITWTKAKSVNKCGFKSCEALAVGAGVYKNQNYGLCASHYKMAVLSKDWENVRIGKIPDGDSDC